MLKRKNKEEIPNLLDLTPEKLVDSEKRTDGLIDLVVPKFKNRLARRIFEKRMKKPTWKVELDNIGSFVWEQIDGNRNVMDIGARMKNKFGDSVEPVYDRLNQFLFVMRSHEFICFREWSDKK